MVKLDFEFRIADFEFAGRPARDYCYLYGDGHVQARRPHHKRTETIVVRGSRPHVSSFDIGPAQ